MPFVSQAQRRFMYAKHPKLAREFEEKTPKDKKLPMKKAWAFLKESRQTELREEFGDGIE